MGRTVDFESYTESEIDLSDVMEEYFPHGLLRVGDIRDEIDFNTGLAISNVQRLAYSAENLETAIASGRTWEADTNWIYLERASSEVHEADVDGQYTVSDHGLEYFTGTDIAVYAVVLYGNNLKNKLERDVVTKSQDVVNGFDSEATDKALSAAAGAELYAHLGSLQFKKISIPLADKTTAQFTIDLPTGFTYANSMIISSNLEAFGYKYTEPSSVGSDANLKYSLNILSTNKIQVGGLASALQGRSDGYIHVALAHW
jgi:hypothetical protein